MEEVVVTGMGVVSSLGHSAEELWSNLLAGKSGIGRITRFDASDIACQIAGEVRDFDITQYISAKDARRMDLFIHFGIAAALQSSVAELYALAEGRTFATGSASSEVHPDDLARDAVQMRRYFRSLSPEYQKLALEIVKTLVRTQAKS